MSVLFENEKMILDRYSDGANKTIPGLCCPTTYPIHLLEMLPKEIIERDYGCGDPSRYIKKGDTVLDLGSGGGKMCYMAAQIVGPTGSVVGVDMNDEMLSLARKYKKEMVQKLGVKYIEFKKCQIQNLRLDLEEVDQWLTQNPIRSATNLKQFENWKSSQSSAIADESVDTVISNCVLNLVSRQQRTDLAKEVFRVLKPGGRIAISDIVSDVEVPQYLQDDPDLWADCVSGATETSAFIQIFRDVGFVGLKLDSWSEKPWKEIDRVAFRSATLVAIKPSCQECLNKGHSVIYKGPYSEIRDDEDHVFTRGCVVPVCEQTFDLLTKGYLASDFIGISPNSLENLISEESGCCSTATSCC